MPRSEVGALAAEHVTAVNRAIRAMNEEFGDPRHLADSATAALYSPWHFHRVFHMVTNTTPARFLAAVRMQNAKVLLADTSLTVNAIRSSVGYQSLGSFTSQFTRLVGVPPGGFRRLVDNAVGCSVDPDRMTGASHGAHGPQVELTSAHMDAAGSTAVIGFFRADLPQGTPATFAALFGKFSGRLTAPPSQGAYDIFGLALPAGASLLDLTLGSCASAEVGHRRITVDSQAQFAPISLALREPRSVDPPIVSAAAAIHLSQGR